MQVNSSMKQTDKTTEPLFGTLDKVASCLKKKNYPIAFKRFVDFIASLKEDTHPEVIEKAYATLDSLIEIAESFQEIEFCINKLLKISSDQPLQRKTEKACHEASCLVFHTRKKAK